MVTAFQTTRNLWSIQSSILLLVADAVGAGVIVFAELWLVAPFNWMAIWS